MLNDLAALIFNIPMFDVASLEISKSADKQFAEIGDIVSYRVQVKNATASAIQSVVVRDVLPRSFVYAAGTAQIEIGTNIRMIEPQIAGDQLDFEPWRTRPWHKCYDLLPPSRRRDCERRRTYKFGGGVRCSDKW